MNPIRLFQEGSSELTDALQGVASAFDRLTVAIGESGATMAGSADVAGVASGGEPGAGAGSGLPDLSDPSKIQDLLVLAKDKIIEYAPALLSAIVILLLGWILARAVSSLLRKALGKSKLDPTLITFACSCLYMAMMAFVVLSAISKLGVNTSSFIAVLGAASFAVGFALQGSLSNFAAGVMLMIFRPIREGDLVEAGGVLGHVKEVGVFATVIDTLDNKRAVVANSSITGGNIINYTSNGKLRVDMTFGIGYGDDMDKAISLMEQVLREDSRVMADPPFTVACSGHGASSVDFVCRPYVNPEHYWDVWFDTHKKVKEAFDAQGVSIPYPQRDIHMIGAEA